MIRAGIDTGGTFTDIAIFDDGVAVDRSRDIEFAVRAGEIVGVDTPGGGGFG